MKRKIYCTVLILAATITCQRIKAEITRGFEFQTKQLGEEGQTQVVSRQNMPDTEMTAQTACYNRKIIDYVKRIFNSDDAVPTISQDSECVVEFLRLNDEFFLDIEDCYSCMRLLNNKVKSCEILDDQVINEIFAAMPERLGGYFQDTNTPYYSIDSLQTRMEKLLLSSFTNHFEKFQASPDTFIHDLSKNLSQNAAGIDGETEELVAGGGTEWRERLRIGIVRFSETCLNRVMWNQTAYEGIWNSLMTTANSIYQLATYQIITHMDDLDDLYWSLTHRFCFFLDLTKGMFPTSFYEIIEGDIIDGAAFFLELGEQDEGIKSKKEFIL
ncbi:hypothetical protein KAU11_01040, partial [Candidatus Babeliales bacterium]|nr:hypothetical protein [Candidatus Babeliales bacterium]